MPDWSNLLDEIQEGGDQYDKTRVKYLTKLNKYTGRNIITYYSGWLQISSNHPAFIESMSINDLDKNGFMTTICGMDRSKGLDLILHTPGGDIAATESLIDYLHSMFGNNIRALVPQLAMSGGTMIACSCESIIMGKQSSLGPVDPQIFGISAGGIVEEFRRAKDEINLDQSTGLVWRPIFEQYGPGFIGDCEKAVTWSKEILRDNLAKCMLNHDKNKEQKIKQICHELGDHSRSKTHERHLSKEKCIEIGLNIISLEDDQKLQDLLLSVHHSYMITFHETNVLKIIENHMGKAIAIGPPRFPDL